jgi:hypothetical protein
VCTESIQMYIDRADQVALTPKPTGPACPVSALELVFLLTFSTPAAGSSFGAGVLNVGLPGFLAEIGEIFAVFPQQNALVVRPSFLLMAHPMDCL